MHLRTRYNRPSSPWIKEKLNIEIASKQKDCPKTEPTHKMNCVVTQNSKITGVGRYGEWVGGGRKEGGDAATKQAGTVGCGDIWGTRKAAETHPAEIGVAAQKGFLPFLFFYFFVASRAYSIIILSIIIHTVTRGLSLSFFLNFLLFSF